MSDEDARHEPEPTRKSDEHGDDTQETG